MDAGDLDGRADDVFVTVDGGAIEMTIAGFDGAGDGGGDLGRGNLVGPEGAEADGGHAGAGVECALRNLRIAQGTSVMPSFA